MMGMIRFYILKRASAADNGRLWLHLRAYQHIVESGPFRPNSITRDTGVLNFMFFSLILGRLLFSF